MQFFILMVDHPRTGFEAVVHPEDTRADIVQAYREASHPVFVKFVDGNEISDITDDIKAEALEAAHIDFEVDVQSAKFDHARDYAKNWEPAQ